MLAACASPEENYPGGYGTIQPDPQFVGGVGGMAQPRNEAQAEDIAQRWGGTNVETWFQDFRGRTVRVQVIKSDSDLKEMRLRLMPRAEGMDAGMKAGEILERVAEASSKRICGKGVRWVNVVYDNPSFDTFRPNPFFDFRADAGSANMREYGFTCEFD